MDYQFIIDTLAIGVLVSTPIIIASYGEIVSELSGVINIGIEGYMLMGTMAGYMGAYYINNAWLGVFFGMIAGIILSLVHAYLCISLGSNQLVSGIGINILAFGLTSFIYRISPMGGLKPTVPSFAPLHIPVLGDIPVIGDIVFRQPPLVYVGFVLSPIFFILVNKTSFGLRCKSVGENPLAAETVGVNVLRVRYLTVMITGAAAGVAGAFLSLSYLSMFVEGMTAGRGFIALATTIVSGWDPVKVLFICLLFGIADAFQLRLQIAGVGIPYSFLMMIPYILTIIILAAKGKVYVPKALGLPYKREQD